jgi:hypothetical protein
MTEDLEKAINRAIEETRRAYEFSPGSYTNSSMQAVMSVGQQFSLLFGGWNIPQGHPESG